MFNFDSAMNLTVFDWLGGWLFSFYFYNACFITLIHLGIFNYVWGVRPKRERAAKEALYNKILQDPVLRPIYEARIKAIEEASEKAKEKEEKEWETK